MRKTNIFRELFLVFLAANLAYLPTYASVPTSLNASPRSSEMISTTTVVEELSRTEAENQIRDNILQSDLQKRLIASGISPSEVSDRLATLSDAEVRQLAVQTQEARYGGDILIAILVVVLIIFLIKRI